MLLLALIMCGREGRLAARSFAPWVCLIVPPIALNLLQSCEPHAGLLLCARWSAVLVLGCGLALCVERGWGRLLAGCVAAAGAGGAVIALWQGLTRFGGQAQRLAGVEGPVAEAAVTRLSSGRVFGPYLLPASLAGAMGITLPVTAALAAGAASMRRRVLWIALAALQIGALIWSWSAGGWFALASALTIVLAPRLMPSARGRMALAAGIAGAVLLIAGGLAIRRSALPQPGLPDRPLAYRAGNWKAAAEIAIDHPGLGTGLGTYGVVYPAYRRPGMNESRYAHCSWLQLIAEMGAGAAPLLALCAVLGFGAWKRGRAQESVAAAGAIGVVAFLIHNGVDFTLYQPSIVALCAAALALTRAGEQAEPRGGVSLLPERRGNGIAACAGLGALSVGAALVLCAAGLSDLATERALAAHGLDAGREERALVESARLDPIDPEARGNLARFWSVSPAGSSGLDRALDEARRAVALDPNTAFRRRDLGYLQLKQGRAAEAWVSLGAAVALYPIKTEYRTDLEALQSKLFPPPMTEAP